MRRRPGLAALPLFIAVALAVALLVVPAAAPVTCNYCYHVGKTGPSTVSPGQSNSYTFRVTNDSTSASMGSADITAPSGTSTISINHLVTSTGQQWDATTECLCSPPITYVLHLRAHTAGDTLAPGAYVDTVGYSATLNTPGTNTWATAAKSSIDFITGDFTNSGSEPTVTVSSAVSLDLAAASVTPTAGAGDSLTITAKTSGGGTATDYTGDKTLTFGGASDSPNSDHPTVTDKTGAAVNFGTPETIAFLNGVATVSGSDNGVMKLYKAESAHITVTDGTINNGTGLAVTVGPAAASQYALGPSTATPTAGSAFSVDFTALDPYGNKDTNYSPSVTVDYSGPQSSPGPVVTPPLYPSSATSLTFSNGTATATGIKLYDALPAHNPVTLTAKDHNSSVQGSTSLTVGPAAASQYALGPSTATPTAGSAFSVDFTALDPYGNKDTNYSPSVTVDYSGPQSSPGPVVTPPLYPSSATSLTFSNGTATATGIKLYDALPAHNPVTLTAKDHNSSVQGSTSLTVGPATASQYSLPTPPTQTAGAFFNETITALDPYGNKDTNYFGNKTLAWGGTPCSPNCPGTAPDGTHTPSYPANPVAFAAGEAAVSITLFKAESPKLGVADGSISGASSSFTVKADELHSSPSFNVQPTLTQVNTNFTNPIQVAVKDPYGNVISGTSVGITLNANGNSGSLSPVNPTATTDSNGLATFDGGSGAGHGPNMKVTQQGVLYSLVATVTRSNSTLSSANSVQFDIAFQVNDCTQTSCTATGQDPQNLTSSNVTVTGVTGVSASRTTSAAAAVSGKIGAVVAASIRAPVGTTGAPVCGVTSGSFGSQTGAAGTASDLTSVAGTFTIVLRIDKSLVKKLNLGAKSYDVCLGAVNLVHNAAGCSTPQSESFPKKGGGCAVSATSPDGSTLFWGLLPDAPSGTKSCTASNVKFPVVLSKTRNGVGDELITYCVPFPYDPHSIGGP